MGVLPLQFKDGQSAQSLGLDGSETFDLGDLADEVRPMQDVTLTITRADGSTAQAEPTFRARTTARERGARRSRRV
jgi:aconitate hydratase